MTLLTGSNLPSNSLGSVPNPAVDSAPSPAKVIILRFLGGTDFISRGIEAVTNSLWCHVEVGVNPAGDLNITGWAGAHLDGGFQVRPVDYCQPAREARYALPVTDSQFAAFSAAWQALVGTPYNTIDILGLLVHDRQLNNRHGVICSQAVTQVCEAAGVCLLNVEPGFEYLVSPETLHLSPLLRGRKVFSQPGSK